MLALWISCGIGLAIAAVAGVTDHRTGRIPNWLTLPPVCVAPLVFGALYGWRALGLTLASTLICGLIPYLMFRQKAVGGGDVKLFAAIGAVTGLNIGLAAEFMTLLVAAVFALGLLAWRGKLLSTLGRSFLLMLGPLVPKKRRAAVSPEMMTSIRLGPFALIGTLLAVVETLYLR
jgi:prepilin peptidase CpaA